MSINVFDRSETTLGRATRTENIIENSEEQRNSIETEKKRKSGAGQKNANKKGAKSSMRYSKPRMSKNSKQEVESNSSQI